MYIDIDVLKKQKSVKTNEVNPLNQKVVDNRREEDDFASGQRTQLKRVEVPLTGPQEPNNQSTRPKAPESEDRNLATPSKSLRKQSESESPLSPESKRFTVKNTPLGLKPKTLTFSEGQANGTGKIEAQESIGQMEAKEIEVHQISGQNITNQPRRPKVSRTIKMPMGGDFEGRGTKQHKTINNKGPKRNREEDH